MARTRNLKPGFFKNELLGGRDPFLRLLFAGLWTLADRAGRLEDRPLRIKAELFPYDTIDCEALLAQLASMKERGGQPAFILRYAIANDSYIQIVNFAKHNHTHVKEPASTIPAPDKPGASPVQAPDKPGADPSLYLLPSTLFPTPSTSVVSATDFDPNDLPTPPRRPQSHPILLALREKVGSHYDWLASNTRATQPAQEAVIVAEVERMVGVHGKEAVISELAALGGATVSVSYVQANRNLVDRKNKRGALLASPEIDREKQKQTESEMFSKLFKRNPTNG